VSAIQAEIKKDGGKPETVNKLGVLYARYGLSTEAAAEFDRILKTTEYAPALVNAGNIAFLTGNAKAALAYYERALKKEPDRATVLLGIARANHELENYGKVQEAYAKLKTVDSTLAAQFTYLDLRGAEATRAADVGGVSETVIWDSK
jgi:tetratricopeptide (TPR) repeat protein